MQTPNVLGMYITVEWNRKGKVRNELEFDYVVEILMEWIEPQIDQKAGLAVWESVWEKLSKIC